MELEWPQVAKASINGGNLKDLIGMHKPIIGTNLPIQDEINGRLAVYWVKVRYRTIE
jgi:hypothetical protein